jgi:uncharacterized protein (TIGR02466 family)
MATSKPNSISLQKLDLFPTRIWQADLPMLAKHHAAWDEWILQKRAADTKPWGSNRGGWNSPKTLFTEPVFKPLASACELVMRNIMKQMGVDLPQAPLRFDAWANVLEQGGSNISHVHQNTLLSAVFYLRVPDPSAPIVFRDPRAGAVFSALRGKGVNVFSECALNPMAGRLVVFPNWLEHRVEVHASSEARISIAMNLLGVQPNAPAATVSKSQK